MPSAVSLIFGLLCVVAGAFLSCAVADWWRSRGTPLARRRREQAIELDELVRSKTDAESEGSSDRVLDRVVKQFETEAPRMEKEFNERRSAEFEALRKKMGW